MPGCFTQLGIRSPGVREAREYVRDQGGQIWTARDLRGLESPAALAEGETTITSIARIERGYGNLIERTRGLSLAIEAG